MTNYMGLVRKPTDDQNPFSLQREIKICEKGSGFGLKLSGKTLRTSVNNWLYYSFIYEEST